VDVEKFVEQELAMDTEALEENPSSAILSTKNPIQTDLELNLGG
jgi:hypothetical protein